MKIRDPWQENYTSEDEDIGNVFWKKRAMLTPKT